MPERLSDLDPDVQTMLRDLMQDDYGVLLQTFLQDTDRRLCQLHESLDRHNWESFRQAAHSFKGSCGNMGALALLQACQQAEEAAANADSITAAHVCDLIDRLCLRIRPQLTCPN
ncbi:HPt (histidine-containing phosphotransfer) domain-containing protein [Halopseudomonas litoralis]|uniref:HPt (Histidine-containing phosphotransfer) domain-containing protein n=1 Tax=Halopseudomonas litoralis TaxID=797277 RepID=A0A1H1N2G1_9GAMM|nr:Hpt domain-containing protein [Halopseudomonas litoralis]SDR93080.1 HPt (histidine-containing phosphotransfer) domain-containing protein [Halopseudomonas litoralis]